MLLDERGASAKTSGPANTGRHDPADTSNKLTRAGASADTGSKSHTDAAAKRADRKADPAKRDGTRAAPNDDSSKAKSAADIKPSADIEEGTSENPDATATENTASDDTGNDVSIEKTETVAQIGTPLTEQPAVAIAAAVPAVAEAANDESAPEDAHLGTQAITAAGGENTPQSVPSEDDAIATGKSEAAASSEAVKPETDPQAGAAPEDEASEQTAARSTAREGKPAALEKPAHTHVKSGTSDTSDAAPAEHGQDSTPATQDALKNAQPHHANTSGAEADDKPAKDSTRAAIEKTASASDNAPAARNQIDPLQTFAATTAGLHAAARASHANAASVAAPAAIEHAQGIPFSGIAVEIAGQARNGVNRFDIRLDPPELGRIDVRLDVDRHGHVTSRLVVERTDTLDLLRRDATQLERALQDAGLKTSDNGLQFSLRDQTMSQHNDKPEAHGARVLVADEDAAVVTAAHGYRRLGGLGGGLDIRV